MNYILTDGDVHLSLLPFTYTRPVGEIRLGITTIREKWENFLQTSISYLTQEYLQKKYPIALADDNLFINGGVIPSDDLVAAIEELAVGERLVSKGLVIAYRGTLLDFQNENCLDKSKQFEGSVTFIKNTWDIFTLNPQILKSDFNWITQNRVSQKVPNGVTVFGEYPIFIEEGAKIYPSTFNTEEGPIYIGKKAEVMEGCLVRGPFALCEGAILKMGAKIYSGSTFGPYCKVGGEVSNSVLFAFSNKGHDGYLGNSVLGEWCNLGADTNTSNLKNNYDEVKLWSYATQRFMPTGLQFCGLMMGDHSKAGINTMFNTGTVVGVSANIFGAGFPRNFIPSFSWGGSHGFTEYKTEKAYEAATAMMGRRNIPFDTIEKEILDTVFEATKSYRARF